MQNEEVILTQEERRLLDEYSFFLFTYNLFTLCRDPIAAQQTLETLCESFKVNVLLINSAVTIILSGDTNYKPKRFIFASLLSKVMPIRDVCKELGMSLTTYYKLKRKYPEWVLPYPLFPPDTDIEITKFLTNINKIFITRSW